MRKPLFMIIMTVLLSTMLYANIDSEKLAENVRIKVAEYYEMDEEFVITANQDGRVTIEGTVPTLWDFYRIFELASKVKGVKSISNQLVIDTPTLPDNMIKSNILQEMQYVKSILEPDRIEIGVDNGIVILEGLVSYNREKKMLQTMISWQKGVKGIVNNIKVLPPKKAVSDQNLNRIIGNLIEKEFPLEEVQHSVKDGVVTLTGKTTTLWALHQIEKRISDLLGVHKVVNELSVEES